MNNFHRHVSFNQHPYFVTHHVGEGAFRSSLSVGQVNQVLPGQLTTKGTAPSHWFSTPSALSGARTIVTLNQRRNQSINRAAISQMNVSRPVIPSAGNTRTLDNAPAVLNGQAMIHNRHFQSPSDFGGRAFNHQTYVPNMHRFNSSPIFGQNRVSRAPRSFGGNVSGGYHGGAPRGGRR